MHAYERCRVVLTFLVIVYNGLSTKAMALFMCEDLVDGTQMLKANPDMVCWKGAHIPLVVCGVIFCIVYSRTNASFHDHTDIQ